MVKVQKRKSYSHNREDVFVADWFKENPPRSRYFVDVGAFDGVTYSNTMALVDAGWHGTLIEPEPEIFKRLERNYVGLAGNLLIKKAVGHSARQDTGSHNVMWTPRTKNWTDKMVATVSQDWMNRHGAIQQWEGKLVEFVTLDAVLADCPDPPSFIDIDCEGLDTEVVASGLGMIQRFQPSLIMVENGGGDFVPEMDFTMVQIGYRRVYGDASTANLAWAAK